MVRKSFATLKMTRGEVTLLLKVLPEPASIGLYIIA